MAAPIGSFSYEKDPIGATVFGLRSRVTNIYSNSCVIAHSLRVLLRYVTQKYPISPRLWAITEEIEYILVTRDRLLNSDRSACRLFAVANRKNCSLCSLN